MGFSAGGQLALLAAMRFDAGDAAANDPIDRHSSRPDFAALVYPGTWPDLKIDADTPPMWLLSGSDDRPEVIAGITSIYLKLREAKVPAELHFYDGVPHGFGLRATHPGPVAHWPQQFVDWLKVSKFVEGIHVRNIIVRGAGRAVHRARVFAAAAGHRPIAGHAHLRVASRRTGAASSRTPSSAMARR